MKFQKQQLFVCFESSQEVNVKVVVSFGGEDKAKSVVNEEQEAAHKAMAAKMEEDLSKKVGKGEQNILSTAARNANEHQKRIRVQIEKMVSN